jgi:hypothetical protein
MQRALEACRKLIPEPPAGAPVPGEDGFAPGGEPPGSAPIPQD